MGSDPQPPSTTAPESPQATACRGVRGATIAAENTAEAIREAISELVVALAERNGIEPADVACALFTTTPDLTASFPAEAVRHLGWDHVPLLGAIEMAKPGAPGRCIRVLLQWNTTLTQLEVEHLYLRGTDVLLTTSPSDSFGLGGGAPA